MGFIPLVGVIFFALGAWVRWVDLDVGVGEDEEDEDEEFGNRDAESILPFDEIHNNHGIQGRQRAVTRLRVEVIKREKVVILRRVSTKYHDTPIYIPTALSLK